MGLWSLLSVGLLGTKVPFSVVRAPKRGVYYALCDAMVFGDVVYEVAETRSLWSPRWKRAFDPMLLDYSEDGSLTGDPRLVLSRDESILVVSRGGQLTDAIDLEGKSNLVTSVEWDAPGREHAWALRTGQVETILKEHGGAAP